MRAYCVVPLWADFVASELDRLEFRFGNLDSRFVRFLELRCGNRQAGARRRAATASCGGSRRGGAVK